MLTQMYNQVSRLHYGYDSFTLKLFPYKWQLQRTIKQLLSKLKKMDSIKKGSNYKVQTDSEE